VVGSSAPDLDHPAQTKHLLVSMIDSRDVRINISQRTATVLLRTPQRDRNELGETIVNKTRRKHLRSKKNQ
jgi:hypothetical protein